MPDAALAEDLNIAPVEEVKPTDEIKETPETESATAEQVETPAEPDEKLTSRGQERFNKITADKYAEKRRADAAEEELNKLKAQIPQPSVQSENAPTLEDFDFDDAKFNEALIDFKVNKKAAQIQQQQEAAQVQVQGQQRAAAFNVKVAEFSKTAPDYQEVLANIPPLPPETLDAVMQAENGPQLAYYLGKHLDVADEIASASPMVAAMQLGAISARLAAAKPNAKQSAAPEPIDPISSGGAIPKSERGPKGATFV